MTSRLLVLLPRDASEASALMELATHFCPHEEYWRLLPSLLNHSLPPSCQEVLMDDLMSRPESVRIQILYRLANDSTHPLCTEARQHLFAAFPEVPPNDMSALGRALQKQGSGRSPVGSR